VDKTTRKSKQWHLFLAHGADDSDQQIVACIKAIYNLFADIAFGDFNVIFGSTIGSHEIEETVVDVNLLASQWKEEEQE
jgi:hypothetical protein